MSLRLRIALLAYPIFLITKLVVINLRCHYLSFVANRRERELHKLCLHVGKCFMEKREVSFVGWHTQPRPGYSEDSTGKRTSEICWEAPVCYTVYVNEKPLVGMAIELQGSTLTVRQLQGEHGVKIPETLHNWPAIFLVAVLWYVDASAKRIETVRVCAAHQHLFYRYPVNIPPEKIPEYRRRMRRRYDGTARKLKFRQVQSGHWVWHKPKRQTKS